MRLASLISLTVLGAILMGCGSGNEVTRKPMAQYPSPMEESARVHERVKDRKQPGRYFEINGVLPRPVDVFLSDRWADADSVNLLIHFHGASYVAREAVSQSGRPFALAVVNLGSGSSVYERPFQDGVAFDRLLTAIRDSIQPGISGIYISSWSAGYGAVRAILKSDFEHIDGIILLDGLHTDYVPDRVTLHDGGSLNTSKLKGFLSFARASIAGTKRMLITHSEIFPGTYASTTETASWLIRESELKRESVLRWGPVGMQLVSEAGAGNLSILGFAGNTAPDHIDHYHGLPTFLSNMLGE